MNGASGVIIRDEQGHIVAASSIWHECVPDTLTAEALACRYGAQLMKTWSIKQAILETDSMEFTLLWWMKHQRSRILTKLIKQIQELTERYNYLDVRHVKREANEAAHGHKLAKLASCTNPECAWDSQVPECIRRCNEKDCNPVLD